MTATITRSLALQWLKRSQQNKLIYSNSYHKASRPTHTPNFLCFHSLGTVAWNKNLKVFHQLIENTDET